MKYVSVTPNLVVSDMDRSVAFYRDVLGFALNASVPDAPPYVFAWMRRDGVSVFLNAIEAAAAEYPALAERPIGGTSTMFMTVEGVDAIHEALAPRTTVVMPLETKFYGMREFAIVDPDGYLITLAERVAE